MMLGALVTFLFTVGISAGIPASIEEKRRLEMDRLKEALRPATDSLSFESNPPIYEDASTKLGECRPYVCLSVKGTVKMTFIPTREIDRSIELTPNILYDLTNDGYNPMSLTSQKSNVSYKSDMEGWTFSRGISGGTGMLSSIALTLSASRTDSSSRTAGYQTSEVETSQFTCPGFSYCYMEAYTVSVTLRGWCYEEFETHCQNNEFFWLPKPWTTWKTCAGSEDDKYKNCPVVKQIKDQVCHRVSPRRCKLTVPLMSGDKPYTHQYDTSIPKVPQSEGFVPNGLCKLDQGRLYNVTSQKYVVKGGELSPLEFGLPTPVLSNCRYADLKCREDYPECVAKSGIEFATCCQSAQEKKQATSATTVLQPTTASQLATSTSATSTAQNSIATGDDGDSKREPYNPETAAGDDDDSEREPYNPETATSASSNATAEPTVSIDTQSAVHHCVKGEPFRLKFHIFAPTAPHEIIKIVGDADVLGRWDEAKAVELIRIATSNKTTIAGRSLSLWHTTVYVEDGKEIEYEYFRVVKDKNSKTGQTERHRITASCGKVREWDTWEMSTRTALPDSAPTSAPEIEPEIEIML